MAKRCRSCCGPPPPNTTFSGKIVGCANLGYPNVGLTFNANQSNNSSSWSGTTDASGNFSGSFYMGQANAPLALVATPPAGSRFDVKTFVATYTVGVAHSYGNILLSITPASPARICFTAIMLEPVNGTTLHCTDSKRGGPFALTRTLSNTFWTATFSGVTYQLNTNATVQGTGWTLTSRVEAPAFQLVFTQSANGPVWTAGDKLTFIE
jgi:hypothetical protein